MVLPSRGVLELEIAGHGGRVNRDCAAVIGAGERHAFSAPAGANRFLVLSLAISESPLASAGSELGKLSERRYVNLTPAAHHLIGYAEQTFSSARPAERDRRLTSFWLELLLDALRQQSDLTPDRPAQSLARAKAFIALTRYAGVRSARFGAHGKGKTAGELRLESGAPVEPSKSPAPGSE
jgi:hypothetical protein